LRTSASRCWRPRALQSQRRRQRPVLGANSLVAAYRGATFEFGPVMNGEKPSSAREVAGHPRKGERKSPRRLRGDRWGKGKEEYAPGSLIVSIWYRTNRRGEYNALATLCKGLETRNSKFFCAPHPQRLRKSHNMRCLRYIPSSKCCENTKFRRVVAALHLHWFSAAPRYSDGAS